jgi:hypothetical protein
MWLQCNLLGVLHAGQFLRTAASRPSLRVLGRGAEVVGVEEGHMTLLHLIPQRARLIRDPMYTDSFCPVQVPHVLTRAYTTISRSGDSELVTLYPLSGRSRQDFWSLFQ